MLYILWPSFTAILGRILMGTMRATQSALRKAIDVVGNGAKLARLIGVSQAMITYWLQGKEALTPDNAIKIERATGGAVRREELLEKIFDRTWAKRNVFGEAA
jgi:DNA-binding transcriptional regulator YdaS (Cro superfamily)